MSRSFIGGGFATKRVPLHPGETVLKQAWCRAACRKPLRPLWDGKLYLTSVRVVYVKSRLSPPLPRVWKVEVPYDSITRVAFTAGLLMWPTITVEAQDHVYDFSLYVGRWGFLPIGIKKLAQEFIDTINAMRRSLEDKSRSP